MQNSIDTTGKREPTGMATDSTLATREVRSLGLKKPVPIGPGSRVSVLGGLGRTGTTSLNEALRILGFNSIHCPQTPVVGADAYTDTPVFLPEYFGYSEKFIFLTRYHEDWFRSCERHFSNPPANEFLRRVRIQVFGAVYYERHIWAEAYRRCQAMARDMYENHLLEMDIREGWQPLCRFLDKKIPDLPFPHLNKSDDHHSLFSS